MSIPSFSADLIMEELNSSLLIYNNISEITEYPDNITAPNHELIEATGDTEKAEEISRVIFIAALPIIIIFGSIGNILTFIIMRRGSMKDVSTCFYMSILALADTGE